jgi:imidazolonepropionase-like amidohydrolase
MLLVMVASAAAAEPGRDVAPFIAIADPVIALRHVTVIDGTGAPVRIDQTLIIEHGRIARLGPADSTALPAGVVARELQGYSVLPGLVGMHDHFYYTNSATAQRSAGHLEEPGFIVAEIPYSAPRLYLAGGVTTLRTTGSIEPYADLRIAQRIRAGAMPGPAIDVTAPYLEGPDTFFAQMHSLTSPEDARRFVAFWADNGMTSFKAYMNITRAQLAAAIKEAHRRHLKLTGHLCSVSWPEAIAAGIDDFEHGPVYTDSEFVSGRKSDVCPDGDDFDAAWLSEDIGGARVRALIDSLISHHVAVTSTLPVFEASLGGRPAVQPRLLETLAPGARDSYLSARARLKPHDDSDERLFRKEMDFEVAFARAGGLLLAGPDPTGNGGVVPGFGDQREVELLVEAGLTPLEALKVASLNGARFLGRDRDIGTLEPGKRADLVLVKGDPAANIEDLEKVEIVFRDGIGYDSARLVGAVRGQVGLR